MAPLNSTLCAMEKQTSLFDISLEANPKDIVFTPDDVARDTVEHFNPRGRCLDPCRGDGAFFKYLPPGSEWCEIREGRDFFDFTDRVDWIVSNPPYSIFSRWLQHSFTVANNIVYLIPINKPFNSYAIMQRISDWGGIHSIYVVGPGSQLSFPIGFAIGAVYFKRDYRGGTAISFRTHNNRLVNGFASLTAQP